VENLRREKQAMEARVEDLRNSLELASTSATRNGEADRNKVILLEAEVASLRSSLADSSQGIEILKEELAKCQSVIPAAPVVVDASNPLVVSLVQEQVAPYKRQAEELQIELSSSNGRFDVITSALQVANDALSVAEQDARDANSRAEAAEAKATQLEEELKAAAATKPSVTGGESESGSKAASPEDIKAHMQDDIKALMQDVYEKACEIFVPDEEGEANATTYTANDVIKRLRAVLKSVTQSRSSS